MTKVRSPGHNRAVGRGPAREVNTFPITYQDIVFSQHAYGRSRYCTAGHNSHAAG